MAETKSRRESTLPAFCSQTSDCIVPVSSIAVVT